MYTFAVWAPHASTVDVVLDSVGEQWRTRIGLQPGSTPGWWTADVEQAGPGTDYAFVVDDGVPTPDPRSAWQPAGVHGPSRIFDPSAFSWTDQSWTGLDARGRLYYELHVGTFTPGGTLDSAIERLGDLADLGVDMVELMPLAAFPGRWGWGYDGVHPYAVHDPYGGPAALQRFVDAAHAHGLGVCLDVVYNHLGPSGNYLPTYGPYFTPKYSTPWGWSANLDDEGAEHARRYLCDNALRWMRDFHVDALRLDAVHELHDASDYPFLAQLSDEVAGLAQTLGRPLTLVAESDLNDARMVTPVADGGYGMAAQWSDDFHHALHTMLTGERQGYYCDFGDLETFAQVLTHVFFHAATWSTFRAKMWGAPVDRDAVDGHAFVVCASNHDQVGNRAVGDRPSATLSLGLQAISAAMTLTSAFTPMLFMGEEWGASTPFQFFTDHPDPDLGQAIRDGRREEFAGFGWTADQIPDPQDHATRDRSVLNWDERARPPHAELLSWTRQLISLRRNEADLRDPDLRRVVVDLDPDARTIVVHRGGLRVVVNLAGDERSVTLDAPASGVLAAWQSPRIDGEIISMAAESVAIVRI